MEPFFTTKPEGYGLGLSICRSILWEVNSTLAIQSDRGRGTRVEFVIPLALPQQHAQSV
jgi:signal transduction histidine kinase